MNLPTFEREMALNRNAYQSLRNQVRGEYEGQYVAIAHGRIVANAPTFDEANAAVLRLDPVPEYFLVFPAEQEPSFDLVYDL